MIKLTIREYISVCVILIIVGFVCGYTFANATHIP